MPENSQRSTAKGGERRGFALMDEERKREIASQGGKAAHRKGTAHEFTSEEARQAGRKGGEVVSQDRAHMAEIGRKGGESRGTNRQQTVKREGAPKESHTPSFPAEGGGQTADDGD